MINSKPRGSPSRHVWPQVRLLPEPKGGCAGSGPALPFLSLPPIPQTRLPLVFFLLVTRHPPPPRHGALQPPPSLPSPAAGVILALHWWFYLRSVGIFPFSADPWFCRLLFQNDLSTGASTVFSEFLDCCTTGSLEGLILKLKLQYLGHLMRRVDSLEKTLMLGKIEGRRRRGRQKMR